MKKTILLPFLLFFIISLTAQDFSYEIGTKWIFEKETYVNPAGPNVSSSTFEIIDQIEFQGQEVFHILAEDGPYLYMYQENDQVYFWEPRINDFQLTYQFEETENYFSNWRMFDPDPLETATIYVDSVNQIMIDNYTIDAQHLRIANNGSYEEDLPVIVYKNIGQQYGGLKLDLGNALYDNFSYTITDLRCFESNGVLVNFKDYPCDSSFVVSNTIEPRQEDYSITPNPTDGPITINGLEIDTYYELFSVSGNLMQKGKTNQQQIFIEPKGIFFLKLQMGTSWVVQKIVRF